MALSLLYLKLAGEIATAVPWIVGALAFILVFVISSIGRPAAAPLPRAA
jgi:hypothetical protein